MADVVMRKMFYRGLLIQLLLQTCQFGRDKVALGFVLGN
jgi:hypothetical protein